MFNKFYNYDKTNIARNKCRDTNMIKLAIDYIENYNKYNNIL